jgi:hypothetical protein
MPSPNPFLALEPRLAQAERTIFLLQETVTRLRFELNHLRGQGLNNNDVVSGGAGTVNAAPTPGGGGGDDEIYLQTTNVRVYAGGTDLGHLDETHRFANGILALRDDVEVASGEDQAPMHFGFATIGGTKYALPLALIAD